MALDLTSLENSILQLKDALFYCRSDLVRRDPRLALHLRAAAIQAFEYTYELTHKMLRRYLEMTEPTAAGIDELSFPQLIRLGFERGLLSLEWADWKVLRDCRNITSHTYDGVKAEAVFAAIPQFVSEAHFLLGQIRRREGDAL